MDELLGEDASTQNQDKLQTTNCGLGCSTLHGIFAQDASVGNIAVFYLTGLAIAVLMPPRIA